MTVGTLYLVPTPIDDVTTLAPEAQAILLQQSNSFIAKGGSIMLVEEAKAARRRWLRFGLPREVIEHFIPYNEHNQVESVPTLVNELKSGRSIYLMSDCGLPAFCDPGRHLVLGCHKAGIPVRSLPFSNSVLLALALSGLPHERFEFLGFLPKLEDQKQELLHKLFATPKTYLLMDTPYRLIKTLEAVTVAGAKCGALRAWNYFLACDLNKVSEEHFYGTLEELSKALKSTLPNDLKKEFVLILSPVT
jgi:16S rRNA (cytidine1402-2'-O)-methyltransferase